MDNTKYLVVEAISETASFRIPEFHNYHKTLSLPPFTTLVGIAGAALGLNYQKAQNYFKKNKFSLGVYGKSKGFMKDLWKAKSTKSKSGRTVIKREIYYNNYFIFVFGSDNDTINNIYNAFLEPVYALTAGSSDSLLKILPLHIMEKGSETKTKHIENCLLFGNYLDNLKLNLENLKVNKEYIFTPMNSPVSYNIPNSFVFYEDNIRKVKERKEYTFVVSPVISNIIEFNAIQFKEVKIPIFKHEI